MSDINSDPEIDINMDRTFPMNQDNSMSTEGEKSEHNMSEDKLTELIGTVSEMNSKILLLNDTVTRQNDVIRSVSEMNAKLSDAFQNLMKDKSLTESGSKNSDSIQPPSNQSTSTGQQPNNQTVPIYRAFEQPKLHCVLPKISFSGTIESDGHTLIHFLKLFEEECRIRKISMSIKPNLFMMQCIEPARSLIRSAAKQWDSWPLFRDEVIKMFCTEADKAYACRALANIQERDNEKYWTLMDRIRSLSYQAYSHEVQFDDEGNLFVSPSSEMSNRITDKFIQCIRDRTLKAVIIAELSREPGLKRDPDYIARFADQSTQYLKFVGPESEPDVSKPKPRHHQNHYNTNNIDRRQKWKDSGHDRKDQQNRRRFYEDVRPQQKNYVNSNNYEEQERTKLQCYGCNGYGHYKNECPTVKKQSNAHDHKQDKNVRKHSETHSNSNTVNVEMKLDQVWKDLNKIQTSQEERTEIVSTFHPDKGVFIEHSINGTLVRSLADTGSDITVASKRWQEKYLPEVTLKKDRTKVSVASEHTLPVLGSFTAVIMFPCSEKVYTHKVVVAETLNCDLIIGTDFMRKHGCNVDLGKNVFVVEENQVPLVSANGKPLLNIFPIPTNKTVLVKNVVIPPYSEKVLLAKVKWDSATPMLDNRQFTVNGVLKQKGLNLINCFVKPEKDLVNVIVANKTAETKYLKRGASLGEIEEVDAFFHEYADVDSNTICQVNRILQNYGDNDVHSNLLTIKHPDDVKNQKLIDFDDIKISSDFKSKLQKVCEDNHQVFSRNKWDLGECNIVQHRIQLKPDAQPVQALPRRVPYHLKETLKEELKNMMDAGIIEKSSSNWSSPLVIVQKRDGGIRICVDLRRVNAQVYNETFPITYIDDDLIGYARYEDTNTPDTRYDIVDTDFPHINEDIISSETENIPIVNFSKQNEQIVSPPVLRHSGRQRTRKCYDDFELYGDAFKCKQYQT